MMRTAIVEAGVVVNTIIAGDGWEPEEGQLAIPSEDASIGDGYANGEFIKEPAAPEPTPDRVTSRQFFLQLEAAGLLVPVEAWIDQQPLPIQIAFERSSTFVRDDAMLQQGFQGLGVTSEQVDAFFTAAAAL
jgi:hypothetical protein